MLLQLNLEHLKELSELQHEIASLEQKKKVSDLKAAMEQEVSIECP